MNTRDLAREVSKMLPEVTIEGAKDVLEKAFEIIPEVAVVDPVRIAGFGEFRITETKPKSVHFRGKITQVPSRMKLKFRAFK